MNFRQLLAKTTVLSFGLLVFSASLFLTDSKVSARPNCDQTPPLPVCGGSDYESSASVWVWGI